MSEKSISVIVMRDQGKSYSLRFSPNTFRAFVTAIIVIPLLLVCSIWFGLNVYNKYVAVLEETANLKNKIEQNRQTVTRLANLERFLQKYSPSMLGLLVPAENVDIDELSAMEGNKEVLESELAQSLLNEQMSFDIVSDSGQEGKEEQKKTDTAEEPKNGSSADNFDNISEKVSPQPAAEPQTDAKQTETAEDVQSADRPLQKVDLGFVGIENMTAKVAAQNLSVSYRLTNLGKKVPLQGTQKYFIYSENNGKMTLQQISDPTDDNFRIKKLKNVKSTGSVMGLNIGAKAQFVVEVVVDGQVVYRNSFTLTR